MKKPKVEVTETMCGDILAIEDSDGLSLSNHEIKEAYEDMVDVLISIDQSDITRNVMGSLLRTKLINTLKKAGCNE